jgi:hypothetical protein
MLQNVNTQKQITGARAVEMRQVFSSIALQASSGSQRIEAQAMMLLSELRRAVGSLAARNPDAQRRNELSSLGVEGSAAVLSSIIGSGGLYRAFSDAQSAPVAEEAAGHFVNFLEAYSKSQAVLNARSGKGKEDVSTSLENFHILDQIIQYTSNSDVRSRATRLMSSLGVVNDVPVDHDVYN